MRKARKKGDVRETSLILLIFKGVSDEDYYFGCKFAEEIEKEFPVFQ